MMQVVSLVIVTLCCMQVMAAQAPAPAPAAPATPAAQTSSAPVPPADYVYTAAGRRDPFVPPMGGAPTASPAAGMSRPPGIAGLMTADFAVRGILESQGTWVAMVRATDGRTYSLRAGDRLMDGTVRAITADAVIVLQQVNDSPSNAKQREVRKVLRGGPEVQ